jgi:hypothetical protein
MKIFLIATYSFCISCLSCNKETKIVLQNKSNIHIDSIDAYINNHILKFVNIRPGDSIERSTTTDSINAPNEILYHFKIYVKDSPVIRRYNYSNDLGYIPDEFGGIINDSLMIIQVK